MSGDCLERLKFSLNITILFYVIVIINIYDMIVLCNFTSATNGILPRFCSSIMLITVIIETVAVISAIIHNTEKYAPRMNFQTKIKVFKIIATTLIFDVSFFFVLITIILLHSGFDIWTVIFGTLYIVGKLQSAYIIHNYANTLRDEAIYGRGNSIQQNTVFSS